MEDEKLQLPLALQTAEQRRGKWAIEEEAYTTRIISDFHKGLLDISSGITLRQFLSNELNCDPMRITKKFARLQTIGKCAYIPMVKTSENALMLNEAQKEIRRLRNSWHFKLQQQDREFMRKKLRSEKQIKDLQFCPLEELSSLTDLTKGEEKIRNALKDFMSESDMFSLLTWIRRANNLLRYPSSSEEYDMYIKHGEQLLDQIKKQIIDYYTQDSGDDGGYEENPSSTGGVPATSSDKSSSSTLHNKQTLISFKSEEQLK